MATTYGAELYKMEGESMADYMTRLAKLRAAGVLGGGAMFDTAPTSTPVQAEITSTPTLGQLVYNAPVRDDEGNQVGKDNRTPQQVFEDSVRLYNYGPSTAQNIGMMLTPFGAQLGEYAMSSAPTAIEGYLSRLDPNSQEYKDAKAFASAGYGPSQGFNGGSISPTNILSDFGSSLAGLFDGFFSSNTPAQASAVPVSVSQPSWIRPQAAPVQAVAVPVAQADPVSMFAAMDKGSSDYNDYASSWGDAISAMESNYDFNSEYANF